MVVPEARGRKREGRRAARQRRRPRILRLQLPIDAVPAAASVPSPRYLRSRCRSSPTSISTGAAYGRCSISTCAHSGDNADDHPDEGANDHDDLNHESNPSGPSVRDCESQNSFRTRVCCARVNSSASHCGVPADRDREIALARRAPSPGRISWSASWCDGEAADEGHRQWDCAASNFGAATSQSSGW